MFVFFFFQAEDGIRDYKVTGVQTCALPIFRVRDLARPGLGAEVRELVARGENGHPWPAVDAHAGVAERCQHADLGRRDRLARAHDDVARADALPRRPDETARLQALSDRDTLTVHGQVPLPHDGGPP